MPVPFRIGVLGLTHDHVWGNLNDLAASNLGTLVAAADPHPELRQKIQAEYGAQVFADYEAMLDQAELDAVYVFCDNATAADVTELAAARGLHVMVEKPMTSTFARAKRMVAACRQAGVQLMVNWPFAWNPGLRKALHMAQTGEIGHLHGVKYRAAHAGPKELGCTPYFYNWLYDRDLNGAGALMDYACYGAALARLLLGQPSRVTGIAGHFEKDYITLEDNAVVVMEWARAMAISEASWTQIGHLTSYVTVIYGSEGTLLVEAGKGGRLLLATRQHEDGIEVEIDGDGPANATEFFLDHLRTGDAITGLCSAEVGRDAQEILEAALCSAAQHAAVSLPLSAV
jgi:predicted dehydrogenase